MSNSDLDNLRHSCAHLLAAAVMELWPNAKRTIGPAIENGFYFDFDFGETKISESDLPAIEKKMREILPSWKEFSRHELDADSAKKEYPENVYKHELIDQFSTEGQTLSFYKSGNYWDLCRGGHVDSPDKELSHFKLLSVAGAYWRGDEKNKMLTRIYGTAFFTQEELEKYLWQLEEAKKRDHRKLGKELDLYHFQSEAPGMPFWHPKGMVIRNELLSYSREVQKRYGYQEVQTPILLRQEVFKQSGHWDHYRDDMFFSEYERKEDVLALKPMNCPGMIQIYKERQRSYRDLPLKLSEYGIITRKEQSGELNGLFRVMQAWQDDAHLFVTESDIPMVVAETIALVNKIYEPFGLTYQAFLSTRPDDFMGEIEVWDEAEAALKESMIKAGLKLNLKEKDGAFYGPKIDYQLVDALGRDWQCATIQLDFQMPEAFNLEYINKDGQPKRPVIIHRTIMGSIERFIGILVEHFAGAFPLWLAPVQTVILPISEKHSQYAQMLNEKLLESGIRSEIDARSESLSARLRDAQMRKIPELVIVGDKEIESQGITVRKYGSSKEQSNHTATNIDDFLLNLKHRIDNKLLN
jgi:threonyl-tRNA synthetase